MKKKQCVIFVGLSKDNLYSQSDKLIVDMYKGQFGIIVGKGKLGYKVKFADDSIFILKANELEIIKE